MCDPVIYIEGKSETLSLVCEEHKTFEPILMELGIPANRISHREFAALYRDHVIDVSLREVDVIGPTHMVIHQESFRQNRTCMRVIGREGTMPGGLWVTVFWEDGSGYNPQAICSATHA